MAANSNPTSMKAWQYSSVSGGLEKNLKINPSASVPKRKPDQHLVQVIAAALNPVDYKPAEIPLVSKLVLGHPATPVIDFAGKVVQPADGSDVKPGQIVFGYAGPTILGGALAQYTVAKKDQVAVLPAGVSAKWGATVCVAGLTAYQTIVPYVKEGNSVFINGGSGGTGVFGIQMAKAKGCYVTCTCSTPNVELCKSLGADEVIDYKRQDILETLKTNGRKYHRVIDNVGSPELYWPMQQYTTPDAVFVTVGAKLTFKFAFQAIAMRVWPGFLGGGKRKVEGFQAVAKTEDLNQIGRWMKEGKVKPIIDSEFKFEDAVKAFERMKTNRAKGKIIVEVDPGAEQQ